MSKHDWYRSATGNKRPLTYTFKVRMGSNWLRDRDDYIRALRDQEDAYARSFNWQATRVLRYHRAGLPKHLPYEVTVTGHEWPLIASAMRRAIRHDSPTYRKKLQNLYRKFGDAKRAQHDEARVQLHVQTHETKGPSGDEVGESDAHARASRED